MCEHELADFDPYLNMRNLSETLASILSAYQDTDKEDEGSSPRDEYVMPHFESEPESTEGQESEEKIKNDAEANEKSHDEEFSVSDAEMNLSRLHLEEKQNTSDSTTEPDSRMMSLKKELESMKEFPSREEAEALYILVNFGNEEALIHALELPKHVR